MKTLRQTITFKTTPEKLYALLLDSKKLSKMHHGEAKMTKRANGKFSVFGGYCHGYNIELVPGKKIVQAWHFKEEGWPDDHFSTCTFLLTSTAKGTKLIFTQTDIPSKAYEGLKGGWKDYYWEPIQQYIQDTQHR